MDPEKRRFYEEFQSTPSARRATTQPDAANSQRDISIHALREEGDSRLRTISTENITISIHALREEGDAQLTAQAVPNARFQSTPSARRATRPDTPQLLPA